MKFLAIILTVFPLALQYWDDTPVVKALKAHVEEVTLAQNEGRAPGSEGEKAVASYVRETFANNGIDVLSGAGGDVFGIARDGGDTLVSRNVIGYIQGYDPVLKDHYIVVGARMDNLGVNEISVDGEHMSQIFSGANGNASGLSVLMELAGQASRNSILFRRSILFVAFGSSTASFAGAWHFLNHTFKKDISRIDAMVNLDMVGYHSKEGLQAFTAGNEDLNHLIADLSSSLLPIKPVLIPTEPYPSDQQIFYAEQIPSVLFTTGRYPEHNTVRDTPDILDYDLMECEVEYLYNFLLALAGCREGVPAFYNAPAEDKLPGKSMDDSAIAWSDCDIPPAFINNINPAYFLEKWVYQYLKYPQSCIDAGIQGRVMVTFTIGADGAVKDVHVTRSVDPDLDDAAVKVVSASPKWKPARRNGQKVACTITIPVEFRLQRTGRKRSFGINDITIPSGKR